MCKGHMALGMKLSETSGCGRWYVDTETFTIPAAGKDQQSSNSKYKPGQTRQGEGSSTTCSVSMPVDG